MCSVLRHSHARATMATSDPAAAAVSVTASRRMVVNASRKSMLQTTASGRVASSALSRRCSRPTPSFRSGPQKRLKVSRRCRVALRPMRRRQTPPHPKTRMPVVAFGMPSSFAARNAASASSGSRPIANRARVRTT